MATTESRTEARSGWSTETESADMSVENPVLDATESPDASADGSSGEVAEEFAEGGTESLEAGGMADVEAHAEAESAVDGNVTMETDTSTEGIAEAVADAPAERGTEAAAESPSRGRASAPDSGRRPNSFLADLTRAMHTAAEAARATTISQYQGDAKAFIEQIHGSSATDVTDFRQQADDDIAAIREWSKAEIARIREETEKRIAARKSQLDEDLEGHAAYIERQIERVQSRITAFEQEMGQFFEKLLAEEDPTRFAALAQNLPEPPPFDAPETTSARPAFVSRTEESPTADAAEASDAEASDAEPPSGETDEAEAAAAALAARFETASDSGESDFAAAEAEAAAAAETGEEAGDGDQSAEGEEIPVMADDALAARLAGLIPVRPEGEGPADGLGRGSEATESGQKTQLVVVGLVSVASIASFKRHLGRVEGVSSVGVSSGPDGEFLFTVGHSDSVSLRDAVQGLPGFQARITGEGDGVINVSAHDPESDS
ncbi:MAG TPA: hypothetical protein VGJ46_09125 [Candidatus Limnocylindrales bacterium]